MEPVLYGIYISDILETTVTFVATFTDVTTIQAFYKDSVIASQAFQLNLNKTQEWLKLWRFEANEEKSAHTMSTNERGTCRTVK